MRATKNSKAARISKRPNGHYPAGPAIAVGLITAAISAAAIWFFWWNGSLVNYGDAESHLNTARRLLDSRTPGYDQLGTPWLPLPHLLMAPFARLNVLWTSGLAGAIPSGACFLLAAIFLFAAARRAFSSEAAAITAAGLFVLNPNALYLQSTAMTEPVFFACLCGTLYFCILFQQTGHMAAVAAAALCAGMGTLTRYEGWFLLPFLAIFFVLAAAPGRRVRAALIFCLIAGMGPLLWLAYNWWVFENPLAFFNGPNSAKAIQKGLPYEGRNNWRLAAAYFRAAAELALGTPLFWMTAAGAVACLVKFKRAAWPFFLLSLPPLFYLWSIHSADLPIHVPALPPFSWYNTRYGLSLLPAAAFGAGALAALLPMGLRPVAALLLLLGGAGQWLLFPRPSAWITWREAQVNSENRRAYTAEAVSYLRAHYQPGESIFTSSGDMNGIYRQLGIPLRRTLSIDNGPQYEATIARPDLFLWATWVVTYTGDAPQTAVDKARLHGPKYELVKEIAPKGGPVVQIYHRPRTPHWNLK